MKKTVYRVEQCGDAEFDAFDENGEYVFLCEKGLRKFFLITSTPFLLVLTSKPTRSPKALAVRVEPDFGCDCEVRYPELGAKSTTEIVHTTFEQECAVHAHQGPDGWAYVWVEVES